jgi:hypothetical protein
MAATDKQPISPEEFKSLLDGLEIVSITVDRFSGQVLDREAIVASSAQRVVQVNEKSGMSSGASGTVEMRHSYDLIVADGDGDDARRLLRLAVTFHVTYATKRPVNKEFFEVFRTTSLPLQVAPFARAWIHDHCLRMGVPPLIMPLVRTD